MRATEGCAAVSVADPFREMTGLDGAVSKVTDLLVEVAKQFGPA